MDNDSLIQWLEGMITAQGWGAKNKLASTLGISPSGLSKILLRRSGFDDKTVRLMSLILTSKAENYPDAEVLERIERKGMVWELRNIDGEEIWTWRAKQK